jgi:hypothetical protein
VKPEIATWDNFGWGRKAGEKWRGHSHDLCHEM